jgi:hypothetical protein
MTTQWQVTGVVDEIALAGCLPGSGYAKIPVRAGQKITVTSKVAAPCDSRGWTNGVGLPFYGPAGSGAYQPLAAGINTGLGMLLGAFSRRKIDGSLTWTDELQIFYEKSLYLGDTASGVYIVMSPIEGYLYLLMNDGDGYADNDGSISVTVSVSN